MRARITPLFAALSLAALPGVCAAQDVTANLTIVPEGGSRLAGGYAPIRLALAAEKPAGLTKAPEMAVPMYGLLKYGDSSVIVALDQPEGKPAVLYVDSNGNGDLTDDAKPEWSARPYKGQGGADLTQYQGAVKATLALGGKPTPVSLGMYMFDPKDPGRAALKNTLLYYRDFVFKGDIALGGKKYPIIVDDMGMTGDFANPAKMSFMIDVNNNGKYERKGEIYPFAAPFNIGGTTYEIKQLTGDKLTLQKSAKTVAEVLPAPDQRWHGCILPGYVQRKDRPAGLLGNLVRALYCGTPEPDGGLREVQHPGLRGSGNQSGPAKRQRKAGRVL
jgi:hypothetical protein